MYFGVWAGQALSGRVQLRPGVLNYVCRRTKAESGACIVKSALGRLKVPFVTRSLCELNYLVLSKMNPGTLNWIYFPLFSGIYLSMLGEIYPSLLSEMIASELSETSYELLIIAWYRKKTLSILVISRGIFSVVKQHALMRF